VNYLRRASGLWCPDYHLRFPPERGFAQPNYILPGHFPAGAVARAASAATKTFEIVDDTGLVDGEETNKSDTMSVSSLPFGDAEATRRLFAMLTWRAGTSRNLDGVTIGGETAVIHVQQDNGGAVAGCAIASALVASGTSGTVVASFDGKVRNLGVKMFRATNLENSAPTSAQSATDGNGNPSLSIPTYDNGYLLAAVAYTAFVTTTWTGPTEVYDDIVEDHSCSGAWIWPSSSAGSPLTVDAQGSSSPNAALVAVSGF